MAASPDSGQSGQSDSTTAGGDMTPAPAPAVPVKRAATQAKKSSGGFFKKVEESRVPIDVDKPHQFKRPLWKHLLRYPAAIMLVVLNVAIFMSFIERLPQHRVMDPLRELFFFGMVGFIDVFMFLPIILEVNRIETDRDGLKVSALFWKARLRWDQITKFEQPRFLKFAVIRTPRSFYLLNKYDLKPFFELAEIISAKMKPTIQDREG
jgi:hypothetical protein